MLNIWQKNLRGEYIFFYFILAALDLVEGFESFFPKLHPGLVLNQKQKIKKEVKNFSSLQEEATLEGISRVWKGQM